MESTPKTSLSGNSSRAGDLPLATSSRRLALRMWRDGIEANIRGLRVLGYGFESDPCDHGRVVHLVLVCLGGGATGSQTYPWAGNLSSSLSSSQPSAFLCHMKKLRNLYFEL